MLKGCKDIALKPIKHRIHKCWVSTQSRQEAVLSLSQQLYSTLQEIGYSITANISMAVQARHIAAMSASTLYIFFLYLATVQWPHLTDGSSAHIGKRG